MTNHNEIVMNGILKSQCDLCGVIMTRARNAIVRATPEQVVSFNEAVKLLKEAQDIFASEIRLADRVDPPTATFTHQG